MYMISVIHLTNCMSVRGFLSCSFEGSEREEYGDGVGMRGSI